MDSIEVEALKLKAIAEKGILSNDYVGARATILRAQQIFPGLENIDQMLAVCDILCAADMEFPGCGIDWYWVLQLPPSADVFSIETQYKKLVALVKPISNEFPGTDSAMKFIKDAFSVLSDQSKRSAFDWKRSASRNGDGCLGSEVLMERDIMSVEEDDAGRNQSTPCSSMGKQVADDEASDGSDQTCVSSDRPSKRQRDLGGGGSVLEQAVDYVLTDVGSEALKEKIGTQEAGWISALKKSKGNVAERCKDDVGIGMGCDVYDENMCLSTRPIYRKRPDPDFYDFEDDRKVESFAVGQIWAAYDAENMPRRYAQIMKIISQQSKVYVTWLKPEPKSRDEKRWFDAGLPISCGSFMMKRNKVALSGTTMFSHTFPLAQCAKDERLEIYPKKGDVWAIYRDCDMEWCSNLVAREGCEYEMVEILTGYSKGEGLRVAYLTKVEGFRSIFQRYMNKGSELSFQIPATKLFVFSHNVPAFRFRGMEMDGVADGMLELDPLAVPNHLVQDFSYATSSSMNLAKQSMEGNCSDQTSITHHPHPHRSNSDTQCYKRQWAAKDFLEDQVWAIYDGPDDMPRQYIKVNSVISASKVSVTFLEPHPMHDDEIQWVEEDLPSVCGIFRLGRLITNLEMEKFSHLVKCERSMKRSFYKIYPRKGEIWAMYKNWHSKWSLSDLNGYQCQVVEILSDFDEEVGMCISLLVQVTDCMTFFQRKLYEGFELTRTLSRRDILSFSHRIPAYMVLGIESHGIPKSSWHLEPDALPPSLSS
ncbi:uncharacterized protein LOC131246633 [Magnolia sinica]|uniref:uncharacterized protein LOC131246633 n=1 Tax=Magnolia sinica TaxID=86752 RepID=UPI002657F48F|nr:uncharacterized protein LOC131246633 [Magnolia sinica]XP_058102938.1 uncharacterized protein LOC131246633 [Magnolia sinica]XP_058102939.1 uncharacterized protein LOC131246633 [Magnolia sinica]XP_058102940.1 uncharacterized protein LOC131246633 [Magnolia sinica]XP_058102941.1 uncharacterized protein LOC131246633 [Magnolia sinica]XP_058102942.1 uncharacterized protein LOC131246633 [Magnolia sinica]XP_058102943.1 uncharacterized protein LOC131246633 [Magnolia sinica]